MAVKDLFLRHYEKMACAVLVVFVAVHVVLSHASSPAEEENRDIEGLLTRIAEREQTSTPPEMPDLSYANEAREPFTAIPEADTLRHWLAYARPYIHKTVKPPPILGPDPIHRAPTIDEPSATRGAVSISWSSAPDNANIRILEWVLERRVGEEGAWEVVTTLPGDQTSFEDTDVQARTSYAYRVTGRAESTTAGKLLPAEEERLASTASAAVQTPRDVELVPLSVTDGDRFATPPIPTTAYITVYKWNTDTSSWMNRGYTVEVGDEIGQLEEITGGGKLDFRSGYRLKEARNTSRTRTIPGTDREIQEDIVEIVVVEIATDDVLHLNNRDNRPPSSRKGGTSGSSGSKPSGGASGDAGSGSNDDKPAGGRPPKPSPSGGGDDDDFFDDPSGR